MRKIEREMCAALTNERNWRKDNTSVEWTTLNDEYYAEVRLHGHIIGEYHPRSKEMWLGDAGWQTVTTKSRLNALIGEFVRPADGIFQKDWTWYLIHDGATLPWTGNGVLPTT